MYLQTFNNLEIKSLGIEMTQKAGNLYAEFSEGTFQIKDIGSISKGYAKNSTLFLKIIKLSSKKKRF